MTIDKKQSGSDLQIRISGRLDTNTAPQLEAELGQSLDGVNVLTFDLADVAYISSAGLRVLLSAQKRMNKQGEMKVTNVCEEVMEIFEVTGFSEILNIA